MKEKEVDISLINGLGGSSDRPNAVSKISQTSNKPAPYVSQPKPVPSPAMIPGHSPPPIQSQLVEKMALRHANDTPDQSAKMESDDSDVASTANMQIELPPQPGRTTHTLTQ